MMLISSTTNKPRDGYGEAFCDFYYIHFWTMKNGLHVFFWWKMILWHIKQSILVICVISNLPYSLRLQLIHIFNFWCYQTRHWKFTFFIVKLYKKGKKYVPKPPLYSYIKYIDPLDPFGLWKHDLNPFFHLIPPSSVCQEKMCFLFLQGQNSPFNLKMKGFFRSPKESISVFSENIKERTVSHWKTREKLQYHDIPPLCLVW